MTKDDVVQKIQKVLPRLRNQYHVATIGIFGSVARGDEHKESDLDVIVTFDTPIGLFDFVRLENELSEVIGMRVDLVSQKALKPIIKNEILQETIYV
ncbi:MAG: nucleotidyltransferase family protein [bacterium]